MSSWKRFAIAVLGLSLLSSGCGPSYISEDDAQIEEGVEDEGDQDDEGGS